MQATTDRGADPTNTIRVAAGTYNLANGETFPMNLSSGTQLIGTAGAYVTIIDATGSNRRVFVLSGNSSSTLLEGFTIKGGRATGRPALGGGIYAHNDDATKISRNIIIDNSARGSDGTSTAGSEQGAAALGGGIYVDGTSSIIVNNLIKYNPEQRAGSDTHPAVTARRTQTVALHSP